MKKTNLSQHNIRLQLERLKKIIRREDLNLAMYTTKKYYDRVRPSILSKELFQQGLIDKELNTWIKIPTHPSYPSGHATQMYLY